MFDALDESIKNLLIKEIPIKKNEIDIVFDQPTDEWASRVNKPTINLYLYDIRENLHLRAAEQFVERMTADGRKEILRNPARVDISYLVTAWSNKEVDQHHLLGLTMLALLRTPFLPQDVYAEGLTGQAVPVKLEVAQAEDARNWSDFWNTLNTKYRPGLTLKSTILMDPYQPMISSIVTMAEVLFKQKVAPGQEAAESKHYWTIGGEIISEKYDPSTLTLIWEEKGKEVKFLEGGKFRIERAKIGTYHLAVRHNERVLKRQKFSVPLEESLKIEV